VIDKDLASSLLATEVGAELLVIATDVPGVMSAFGTPKENLLRNLTVTQVREFLDNEAVGQGSMGPKLEASVRFLSTGGKRAVICSVEDIAAGVAGSKGTQITD